MKNTDVAIVTGASRGIGRSLALRLAREGCAVLVNYSSNESQAAEVARELSQAGGRALAVRADVSKPDEAKQLFDAAERTWGPVTVLVNNAGVGCTWRRSRRRTTPSTSASCPSTSGGPSTPCARRASACPRAPAS